MKRYVLVSADVKPGSGMGRPNYELARYLAEQNEVHLVAYEVARELMEHPRIIWHRVPKPLNSYILGEPLLRRYGQRVRRQLGASARLIGNGGNCLSNDVTWAHYVHAAYRPLVKTSGPRRVKAALTHRQCLRDERRALQMAQLVIANSDRTARLITEHYEVAPERVRTVYLGVADEFKPAMNAERSAARVALGWPEEGLTAVFVGALGDRRKGFDALFAAWQELCRDKSWDVELAVAGVGAEARTWQERSRAAELDGRIRWLGHTNDIATLLRASDALVSPARYEPYGLNAHEALCCGLPAFVTRTAGVAGRYPPELAELLLDAPPEAADIVGRLRRWREDVAGYRARVASFGADLRQRSWRDMAREIVDIMETERRSALSL